MANSTTDKRVAQAESIGVMAVLAPAIGWLIPGAGHMMHWTKPAELAERLMAFL